MKIYLKVIEPTSSRLYLTRLIRQSTGMSLVDSKWLCDRLNTYPFPCESINIIGEYTLSKFKQELSEIQGKFLINGDAQQERDLKILSIGIGDDIDYTNAIIDHLRLTNDNSLIEKIISKLDRQGKIEIIKSIIDDISGD